MVVKSGSRTSLTSITKGTVAVDPSCCLRASAGFSGGAQIVGQRDDRRMRLLLCLPAISSRLARRHLADVALTSEDDETPPGSSRGSCFCMSLSANAQEHKNLPGGGLRPGRKLNGARQQFRPSPISVDWAPYDLRARPAQRGRDQSGTRNGKDQEE